jgi:transcriptional regulator with XRE-family HTH domain
MSDRPLTSLAEKIDWLFRTKRRKNGKEYTYSQVERGTRRAITGAYVWKLRTGDSSNPSYKALKALADFFDVPLSFFWRDDVTEGFAERLHVAHELEDEGVMAIALRAAELNEDGKRAILEMIEYVRRAQGSDTE